MKTQATKIAKMLNKKIREMTSKEVKMFIESFVTQGFPSETMIVTAYIQAKGMRKGNPKWLTQVVVCSSRTMNGKRYMNGHTIMLVI